MFSKFTESPKKIMSPQFCLEARRDGELEGREEEGRGERSKGEEGEVEQTMYTHIKKYKNNKKIMSPQNENLGLA
jgi:hypothetical protein